MKHTMYLHSTKDGLHDEGEDQLGLSGDALDTFKRSLYEVIFECELDKKTGEITVLTVDVGDGGEIFTR